MTAAREALNEAGIVFEELAEDPSLAQTLRFPKHRVVVLPFVDMLLPGSFEIIEKFVAAGGKVIGQCCYAGEYAWWPDSGFHFSCYLFSHDYRGPLLANMTNYLTTGKTLKPSRPPLSAPRSIPIGLWQSASLLPKEPLAEWDLSADTLIFWAGVMEQPRERVESNFRNRRSWSGFRIRSGPNARRRADPWIISGRVPTSRRFADPFQVAVQGESSGNSLA